MRIRARWALGAAAAIGLGAAVAGPLPGGAAPARAQEADTALDYTCTSPAGTAEKVAVRVQGTFPADGTVGKPVRPGRVTATVTIPKASLGDVTALGGASVVGTARLTASVTQNGKATEASWPGLVTPATPVADDADLVLPASGDVPPVTPSGTGDLTFSAGDLALTLSPRAADGTEPKTPKTLALTCAPVKGRTPVLATVPISGPAGTPAPEASAAPKAAAPKAAPGTPADCGKYHGPTDDWYSGCTYLSGFSNVRKLNGATIINDATLADPVATNVTYTIADPGLQVRQRFLGPLRSRSTFLTFGMMPTTATMEMTQRPLNPGDPKDPQDYGTFVATDDGSGIQKVEAHMRMSIRIYDVKVNGTPLDVGGRCRTGTDADLRLKGQMPSILNAGVLDGTFTIPAFSGCGVGEDLDPLFNGSVAGPGNLLRMGLAATCIPDADLNCPPVVPDPPRTVPPAAPGG
ncbi:DUF6801 domain-containing protein [Actinomadura opuntiae]|uniref:DUF6801 domain-containing protein n=1 Tax=Actinomadura sp. OS1-43 TaxID=604315 RepID=UPI00255AC064|nr:DUF6801 domain-containing protein [Actinomadura sp. OS1-43]MDL4818430.1 hypothetical protein [Actinomadura sp. OS1-43]